MKRFCLLVLLVAIPVCAHEVRPAYLVLHEDAPEHFSVFWKIPVTTDLPTLETHFSGEIKRTTPVTTNDLIHTVVETWQIQAATPLRGQTLHIKGLEECMMDTLVRVEFADGTTWVQRLTDTVSAAQIPAEQTSWSVACVYIKLGIEHILLGIDHLLFVLALLIISKGVKKLIMTITAFTLAHSITLALATLGLLHVPSAPVEATIALSIVFVAAEIVRARRGQIGIATRAPWTVAFTFGLLHGFGFAGALSEVGLPTGHIPVALLFFNVGVEVGQLIFVVVVIRLLTATRKLHEALPRWTELIPPYAIGTMAMFWVIQRTLTF